MRKFGKYAADGSVEVEPEVCILTERAIDKPYDNTVRERVTGTPYFYRVLGSQYHRVTDEMREGWQSEGKGQVKPAAVMGRNRAEKVEVSE